MQFIKKHKIKIIIALILIVAVYYWYSTKPVKKEEDTNPIIPNPKPGSSTVNLPLQSNIWPLKKGMKTLDVGYLQRALNKIKPSNIIKDDNDFGENTYTKLITTMGNSYYPVDATKFAEILNKANKI